MLEMSLAYRIATQRHVLPHPSTTCGPIDIEEAKKRLTIEAQLITRSAHLRLDNVAEFYASHDQTEWDMQEDIPNWAPPFQQFFVEWRLPRRWKINGQLVLEEREAQFGYFVVSINVTDDARTKISHWKRLVSRLLGIESVDMPDERIIKALQESRWLLHCSSWMTANVKPLCSNPLWLGLSHFMFVSPTGRLVDHFVGGVGAQWAMEMDKNSVFSPAHVLGLGVSFCHCKNVRKVENEEARKETWHRTTGVPKLKYYTLDIGSMKETIRSEGRSDELGIKRALHICRGHFATYSPDSPLFGKHVGTYWRPDHVRGKSDSGVVLKDYNVMAK